MKKYYAKNFQDAIDFCIKKNLGGGFINYKCNCGENRPALELIYPNGKCRTISIIIICESCFKNSDSVN